MAQHAADNLDPHLLLDQQAAEDGPEVVPPELGQLGSSQCVREGVGDRRAVAGYGKASFDFASGKPLELLDGANLLYLLEQHAGITAKIVVPETWVDVFGDIPDPDEAPSDPP